MLLFLVVVVVAAFFNLIFFLELNNITVLKKIFYFHCMWTDPREYIRSSAKSYCHPNPCLHGGKCTDSKSGYTCKCIGSYRGVNCEGIQAL